VNEDELTVVYFDGKNNNIKKAVRSGDIWIILIFVGDDGVFGFHNEIASIGGTLYAACYNYGGQTVWFEAID
jgi:hypothetical protein